MHQKRHGGEQISNLKPQKHNVEQKSRERKERNNSMIPFKVLKHAKQYCVLFMGTISVAKVQKHTREW